MNALLFVISIDLDRFFQIGEGPASAWCRQHTRSPLHPRPRNLGAFFQQAFAGVQQGIITRHQDADQ